MTNSVASTPSGTVSAAQPTGSNGVPKEVLAFYYPWYGNPTTDGQWVHWQPDSTGTQATNITYQPSDGLYSSHNPTEVAHQIAEAQSAGITGFIASWWGQGDFTDKAMPTLLNAADQAGMKITAYVEPGALSGSTEGALMSSAESDLLYLVKNYASDPAWLTVGGKPVVFIYGSTANELSASDWQTVLSYVNANTPNGIFAVGPKGSPWESVFNAVHDYSHAGDFQNMTLSQIDQWCKARAAAMTSNGMPVSTIMVMPGADNSHDSSETLLVDSRMNGQSYATQWQDAIAANPDWVLISTWNEYHEGTGIEPTTAYGNSYLTETKTYVQQFVGSSSSTPAPTPQDTLDIAVSEDAWQGDAQFTISVDGQQVGGVRTTHVLHATGDDGHVLLTGNWGAGQHDVKIAFINDAWGGTAATDRNLYVDSIALDGKTYAGTSATFLSSQAKDFAVGGTVPTTAAAPDKLVLHLSEDAWQGDAQFQVSVDGKTLDTREVVTALHAAGASQDFTFTGNFGNGPHDVGVSFVNDAWGGTPATDRNLYVNSVSFDSHNYAGATLLGNGTAHFTVSS